jgi:hypothetical protein
MIQIIPSGQGRYLGHVACMGGNRNAYRILVGKPEGMIALTIVRREWEDNIKTGLKRNRMG